MNIDLKNKWIAALRSGDYKQGHYDLYRDGSYCCLGVLCKIDNIDFKYTIINDKIGNEEMHKLVYLNDCLRKNFDQIADYIEENL